MPSLSDLWFGLGRDLEEVVEPQPETGPYFDGFLPCRRPPT